ncbi:hypothetical protein [Mucilaginibacter aquatilis]|uniref:Transglutaminase domain-containing protein n=1 Tax=Mucilaginibacter aquatilis TaxID=1517760 RepID=A0A6I4IQM7_9SPHI|nr:hypothetical protein [Mucilaginibacter aquatilis]MVN91963.1 hypothetical protein [Mucilaginibacter aquatilis]
MKVLVGVIFFALYLKCSVFTVNAQGRSIPIKLNLYNDPFVATADVSIQIPVDTILTQKGIKEFYSKIIVSQYKSITDSLIAYKKEHQLNDWLYYQLVRRVAEQISPKKENYPRYTLYKWFLLAKTGYDARLALAKNKLIFYVYNDEDIRDIPFFMIDGKKYMCLNYHDYPKTNLNEDVPYQVKIEVPEATMAFSYAVTRMPDFKPEAYFDKQLAFVYEHKQYSFKIKLNKTVDSLFTNYPGVSFKSYFNIPLTKETYGSFIPLLKQNVKGMDEKRGVDYLMRFTRYAFLYEDDEVSYGKEKRMSPEETLFNTYSDCDDRAALFFYLVKEIYNRPMIALLFPTHLTIAVQFDKPVGGESIMYNGKAYWVCEPTLQPEDLKIGQLATKYKHQPFEVVYQYQPEAYPNGL